MRSGPLIVSIENRRTERFWLLALIWLLLFFLIFMHTPSAAAHSSLVKSEPQDGEVLNESPARVTAWFSEELDAERSTLRVFDSQNNQVHNGAGGVDLDDLDHLSMAASLPALSAGTYTVQWVSVSVDDRDAEEGQFAFRVGNGAASSESPTPAEIGSSTWLLGGTIAMLLFILVARLGFNRRNISP